MAANGVRAFGPKNLVGHVFFIYDAAVLKVTKMKQLSTPNLTPCFLVTFVEPSNASKTY